MCILMLTDFASFSPYILYQFILPPLLYQSAKLYVQLTDVCQGDG
jgi:hypothetical protein